MLAPKKPFQLSKPVELRVNGLAPSGLEDSIGRLIDGDHDGQPGGNAMVVLRSGRGTIQAVVSQVIGLVPTFEHSDADGLFERRNLTGAGSVSFSDRSRHAAKTA
jgi:hypothetical protein